MTGEIICVYIYVYNLFILEQTIFEEFFTVLGCAIVRNALIVGFNLVLFNVYYGFLWKNFGALIRSTLTIVYSRFENITCTSKCLGRVSMFRKAGKFENAIGK